MIKKRVNLVQNLKKNVKKSEILLPRIVKIKKNLIVEVDQNQNLENNSESHQRVPVDPNHLSIIRKKKTKIKKSNLKKKKLLIY